MTRVRGASRPRFRLLPTVLLTVAILGLPTIVYALGRSSSSFAIKHIDVSGTKLLPEKRVLRLLRHDYTGHNLFTVTSADVRSTLTPLPYVAGVAVDRDFPDTLRVTVAEYVPVAYGLAGSRWYVLDAGGYVIRQASGSGGEEQAKPDASPGASSSASPSPSVTPSASATATSDGTAPTSKTAPATSGAASGSLDDLMKGPAGGALRLPRVAVNGRVRVGSVADDPVLRQTLQVIAALPQSLRTDLDVIENDGVQLTLRFANGPVTAWGDAQRTLAKTIALRTVLARYRSAGKMCTQLDVSIPDRVLAKPVLAQVLE